jgi:leucyl aminopeptidase
MELVIKQGTIAAADTDMVVVPVFNGKAKLNKEVAELDSKVGGLIGLRLRKNKLSKLLKSNVISYMTKSKELTIALVGFGAFNELTPVTIRKAIAQAMKIARENKASTIAFMIPEASEEISPEVWGQAIAEGAILGAYRFNKYKTKQRDDEKELPQSITLFEPAKPKLNALRSGVTRGQAIAQAIISIRDIINEPPTKIKPKDLAGSAQTISEFSNSISLELLDKDDLEKQGYSALLAVAAGSAEPPFIIHLHYKPEETTSNKTIAFVGKGVTFDSGGLGIKPWAAMRTMKTDMAGAAAVLGIFQALAYLESADMAVPYEVHGVIVTTENMISGSAMRPDDIIETKSGKTIEVAHTDAEGRLILSDALTYTQEFEPDYIIDYATLTGAAIKAVGRQMSAYMGNNRDLLTMVNQASNDTGELAWELPLYDPYKEYLKSGIADIQNIGNSDSAPDAIMGGLFLQEFIDGTPWVHIDIAGPSWQEEDNNPVYPKGATGYGVLLGLNVIEQLIGQR